MSWAYVDQNDNLQEFSTLPENWGNVSNLFALENDLETLKQLGWYQLIDTTTPLISDLFEYHGPVSYTINHSAGTVTKNCPVLQKENPPTSEQSFLQNKDSFLNDLRIQRNERLKECDWTQLTDIQITKPVEWIEAWRSYRQSLRDLPQVYTIEPYELVTDIHLVQWPQPPLE